MQRARSERRAGTRSRRVTLPTIRPALVAGAVLAWARALGEFGATITFAGNFPGTTQTMPLAVYLALESNPEQAIVLALVLIAVSFGVLVGLRDRWFGRGDRVDATVIGVSLDAAIRRSLGTLELDVHLAVQAGRGAGPARPERRRQEHGPALPRRARCRSMTAASPSTTPWSTNRRLARGWNRSIGPSGSSSSSTCCSSTSPCWTTWPSARARTVPTRQRRAPRPPCGSSASR